jgi:excisionase family DNA binding protein
MCPDGPKSTEGAVPAGTLIDSMQIASIAKRQCDQLLSVSDAARRLRISTRTVYRLISEGRVKAVKLRGATRVRESDLAALVDQLEPLEPSG